MMFMSVSTCKSHTAQLLLQAKSMTLDDVIILVTPLSSWSHFSSWNGHGCPSLPFLSLSGPFRQNPQASTSQGEKTAQLLRKDYEKTAQLLRVAPYYLPQATA
mmetsp:Transcript_39918/g.71759  ORF Transcript_39918/g.71759 Transcript_39918/m.71759 type:complete len:103 (-) Transcript_39918:490-798(-)